MTDLPAINKGRMMEHGDDWATGHSVSSRQINDIMRDKDNIGRKRQGKSMVVPRRCQCWNSMRRVRRISSPCLPE